MMANRIKLKKLLLTVFIISFVLLFLFLIINIYEYRTYTKNYNIKLAEIISALEKNYPNLSENEIIRILNSKDISTTLLKKYSIDINRNSIILENENMYRKFLTINAGFLILSITTMVILFLKFNNNKDREISEITKYIEEINKKNYKLHIDEMSEDELSILKNEIYKTTIMLKQDAENSKKEKLELKDSLSDISHQLKTPLTSILIILDNLIDEPTMDNETREDFIRDIKREIININFLVQSILKLSKLDTNTVNFIEEDIYIKDIIEEVTKNLSMLCDLRNIKIKTIIKKNPQIKCDYKWQVEAINNIVKDCIEHSNNDSEIIAEIDNNKAYSSITIKDFGTGIDKEDLPHIFERFYKGKNATQDSIGIGLSLAKTIIEKDNGSINVISNSNGTTFIIKYFNI